MVESILRRVVAKWVHGCPFPILPYIHHYISPSSRNHLQFCAYSIYTMPAASEIVVATSDAFFLQHTCDILLRTIFSEQFDRIQVEPYTHW